MKSTLVLSKCIATGIKAGMNPPKKIKNKQVISLSNALKIEICDTTLLVQLVMAALHCLWSIMCLMINKDNLLFHYMYRRQTECDTNPEITRLHFLPHFSNSAWWPHIIGWPYSYFLNTMYWKLSFCSAQCELHDNTAIKSVRGVLGKSIERSTAVCCFVGISHDIIY